MNRRILLVEDEQELCMTLGDRMRSHGYDVAFVHDGAAALSQLATESFDLVILDLMLPNKSGLEICAEMRQSEIHTPILLLTALNRTIEKIAGFKMGADDYVTKPFDTLELMARIEALLRRSRLKVAASGAGSHRIRIGNILLDVRRQLLTHDSENINLTSREFQLLWYLVEHRGQTISRDELLQEVWGHLPGTLTRTVDMHIASLRQKLRRTARDSDLIFTDPGKGYRFALDA